MNGMKKALIVIGVILALVVAGVFVLPRVLPGLQPGGAENTFQTEPAQKGSLTAYVGASGTVRTNQTADLLWQTSGKVGSVNVQKGQQVAANEDLASLAQTSLPQNIIMAQIDLVSAKKDLQNALDNTEARSNAQLALIQAQQALQDAEKESRSKLYRRASQDTIDIARANLILANQELNKAEDFFASHSGGGENDPTYAAALSQLAKARQEKTRAEYNLRYTESLPDPLSVEEVYAKLDQAKAKLLTAKKEWERIKDGPDPSDVASAEARVAAAQATLDLDRLTAPFSGVITATLSRVTWSTPARLPSRSMISRACWWTSRFLRWTSTRSRKASRLSLPLMRSSTRFTRVRWSISARLARMSTGRSTTS
jgi:HlyD family secretion protein